MNKSAFFLLAFATASILLPGCMRTFVTDQDTLMDKIKGGWAGQAIGCTYGGPTEFRYQGRFIPDSDVIAWPDGAMKWYYDNAPGLYDDIYMDLTFVSVFDRLGLDAPVDSMAKAYADAPYPLWHANQQGRYNLHHGISPSEAGHWMNNPHADDIDFQIEADYAGLMAPGLVNCAAYYCDAIGHIMNYGDGWYGGVYVAAMYSLAFVEDSIGDVVTGALKMIPSGSTFHECMSDVIRWHEENPDDWHRTWDLCQQKWAFETGCPDGVFASFDIDAKLNSAYILIGLLYGEEDFSKTLEIATRCGQDSDCNPASAGGILGTLLGYSGIPEVWKKNLPEVEDRPFSYTDISLNDVYCMSYEQSLEVIRRAGGTVKDGQIRIPVQKPREVAMEQSFEGMKPAGKVHVGAVLGEAGYSGTFEGTGVVLLHDFWGAGEEYVAQVEISIDSEEPVVVELPASFHERREQMFHLYGLEPGSHTICVKWLNPEDGIFLNIREILTYDRD